MSFRTSFVLFAASLITAACGGKVVFDGSSGAGGVQCASSAPMSFPTFDKTCSGDADCVSKIHEQAGCCAASLAIGMNASEGAAFDAAEKICKSEQQTSVCDCFRPTVAEDGKAPTGGAPIQVACQSGQCMTFMP